MSLPVIAKDELRANNTAESCWVAIRGKVYHIPKEFIQCDHPGGDIIMEAAGKDGQELFEVATAHSEHAREVMKEFLIGTLGE